MIQYQVVFDVTQTQFSHWSSLTFAAISWIVTLGLIGWQCSAGWCLRAKKLIPFSIFLFVFSSFATLIFCFTYHDYLNLKAAMQQSQCQLVEGTVEKFHVHQWKSSSNDIFSVNGVEFTYNGHGGLNNGFHESGILHNGMMVRIYCFGPHPQIARLEVAP